MKNVIPSLAAKALSSTPDVSPNAVRKLWLTLSVITTVFVVSAYGETQGSDVSLQLNAFAGLVFAPQTPDSIISLWSIFMVSILMLMSNPLMRKHAELIPGTFFSKYPFRIFDIPPECRIGRTAQCLSLITFNLLPMVGLLHFWRVFVAEGVICARQQNDSWSLAKPDSGALTLPGDWSFLRLFNDSYRMTTSEVISTVCGGKMTGTTYFPVFEPILLIILTLLAFITLFRAANKLAV
jgi:hypothetical protein